MTCCGVCCVLEWPELGRRGASHGYPGECALDTDYRIDSISSSGFSYDYTFDAVGNVVELSAGATSVEFSYDDLYRLIELSDAGPSPLESFSYDATGNP